MVTTPHLPLSEVCSIHYKAGMLFIYQSQVLATDSPPQAHFYIQVLLPKRNSDTGAAPAKNTHESSDIFLFSFFRLRYFQTSSSSFTPRTELYLFCFEYEASAVALMFTYFKQATHTKRSRSFHRVNIWQMWL